MENLRLTNELPKPEAFINLRVKAGLSTKSLEGATIGLKNSWYSVALYNEEELVGFGRIIGDGGTVFQITDVAVLPEYQGQGLGKCIMTELTDYITEHASKFSYVSLIADGPAYKLYEKYGFKDVSTHGSKGMYLWMK